MNAKSMPGTVQDQLQVDLGIIAYGGNHGGGKGTLKTHFMFLTSLLSIWLAYSDRGKAETTAFIFPPKPPGLTNLPDLAPPEIDVPTNLTQHLGGREIVNMASASIRHLLDQSGRFVLTEDTNGARCRCRVTLSGLQAGRTDKTNATSGSKILEGLQSVFTRNPFAGTAPTNASRTVNQHHEHLDVKVLMEIIDSDSGRILATGEGSATESSATTNASGGFAGVDSSTSVNTTNDTHIRSDLFEEAAYGALTNMLLSLDDRLAALPAPTKKREEKAAQAKSDKPDKGLTDATEHLKQLKEMLDAKLIDKDDYDKMKKAILDSVSFGVEKTK